MYRAEVYRCPEWKLWAVLKYDEANNPAAEAEWLPKKSHAIYEAEKMLEAGEISEIRIFKADGELQRIIK